jgi:hypothetical protein
LCLAKLSSINEKSVLQFFHISAKYLPHKCHLQTSVVLIPPWCDRVCIEDPLDLIT